MIFIKIVIKANDDFINKSIKKNCNLKINFYENLKIKLCILKRGKSIYLINAIINSGCFNYLFINKTIVREICKALNINLIKLNKSKKNKRI